MNLLFQKNGELDRRNFLAGAASSFLGVGLPRNLSAKVQSPAHIPSAKRVIYLYMTGGMSHLDTFDPKPGSSVQGPTRTISTSGDHQISHLLPNLAKQGHHLAVIRSLNSPTGAHPPANYLMHTSYAVRGSIKHPAMGAWLMDLQGADNTSLPNNILINGGSRHPGAGFLPPKVSPIAIGDPNQGLQNAQAVTEPERFQHRFGLTRNLSEKFFQRYDYRNLQAYADMYDDAVKLMDSTDLEAFDITAEPAAIRNRYGRDPFGQGCLLARRLVEFGVRFIEVNLDGWDTHVANFERVPERCSHLDKGMAALLSDLESRGLLEDTLVVLATEFGRTPEINVNKGRDHFPKAFSAVLAGGGIKGGSTYGKTDKNATNILENPIRPKDLNATIAYALGLPLEKTIYSPNKRPFTVANKGKPILELFA